MFSLCGVHYGTEVSDGIDSESHNTAIFVSCPKLTIIISVCNVIFDRSRTRHIAPASGSENVKKVVL